jgi:hypothetical protein
VTVQHLHWVKYLCDCGTDNYNLICPGIKGAASDVLLLLQQAEWLKKSPHLAQMPNF